MNVIVSDDSASDLPIHDWDVPIALTEVHNQRIIKMWLDFARQNMKLKEMVSDIVATKLKAKCQRCSSQFRLQVVQKVSFQEIVKKYRQSNMGIQFTRHRWRRFFTRHQFFVTFCMECAYIDNLKQQSLKEKDGDLQKYLAEAALKNLGSKKDDVCANNLSKPQVRMIIIRWITLARSNLLH